LFGRVEQDAVADVFEGEPEQLPNVEVGKGVVRHAPFAFHPDYPVGPEQAQGVGHG
jgi:hypothetical protein